MKILQIMPAPAGSYIVDGPYDEEPDSVGILQCALIALCEDDEENRFIIPVAFKDEMDPEITDRTALLYPDLASAQTEAEQRIKRCDKQNG